MLKMRGRLSGVIIFGKKIPENFAGQKYMLKFAVLFRNNQWRIR